jgi:hypothetical protein
MISRRSFLAAVMGAVAAPSFEPKHDANRATDDLLWRYCVWDSATILPGSVVNERLLPPPVPDDFSIASIGLLFNPEAPYKSLAEVLRVLQVGLKNNGRDLLQVPAFRLPADQPYRMVFPHQFKRDSDLDIRLDSLGPVQSVDPVTVTVMLQGFVLLPKGVQRLRNAGVMVE